MSTPSITPGEYTLRLTEPPSASGILHLEVITAKGPDALRPGTQCRALVTRTRWVWSKGLFFTAYNEYRTLSCTAVKRDYMHRDMLSCTWEVHTGDHHDD